MSEFERIGEILARLGEPVFLARQGEGDDGAIALHTMQRRSASRIAKRMREALARESAAPAFRVVAHNPRALRRVRSLEALTRRFGDGRIVYDPTGFVARSEAIAACARSLRTRLGASVRNVYLDTSRRTLYVIVKETKSASVEETTKERGELVRRAGAVMREWQQQAQLTLAVRIGTEPPRGARLVSVDSQSVAQTVYAQILHRKGLVRGALAVSATALFGATMAVPAVAGEPAVAATNGSIIARGGSYDLTGNDSKSEGELLGKVTFPLAQSFGAQAEAGVGTDEYYGVGGQLFWRDPSWARAGLFVAFDKTNDVEITRYGATADFYLGNLTLAGRIGGQSGDVGEGLFGRVDVTYYITQNLLVTGGAEFEPHDGRDTVGRVGFEWQPAMDSSPSLSVFADGEWGDDYDHVRAGLKIHFGVDGVSMIDRHRKFNDDIVLTGRRGYEDSASPSYGPPS